MKFVYLFCLLLLFSFLSCNESAPSDSQISVNPHSLVVDQGKFDMTWSNLQSDQLTSDPFDLNGVRHEGSLLLIEVSYSGGCVTHAFELIWPELTTAIFPPRYTIVLKHNSNEDSCEAYLSDVVSFDLSQYGLGLTPDVVEIMDLTIINGSNPDDSLELNN